MNAIRRNLRSLPVILATVLVVGACSSGSPVEGGAGDPPLEQTVDPLARVLSASDEALDAESMHMTFDLVMGVAGEEITGSGEIDAAFGDELRQHMTFRYDSLPEMPDGLEMEMIVDGSVMYLRADGMGASPFPTEWVSVDMSESVPGFDELTALGNGQQDPSNAFGFLQGAQDAVEVGTETIDGVETTHYEVTVDLADSVAEVPAEMREELRRALEQFRAVLGTTTMPFEIWVDDEGLARRVAYSIESKSGPMGAFSMEMTMDITEYGNDFELEIPAADDVTDLTDLASRQGGQGAGEGTGWS